jgi:hypothetical protein
LSGGQILISDDMTKLTKQEIDDAKLVIPPYNPEGYDPVVSDALISELPTIYFLETDEFIGKRYLTSIINWDDDSKNQEVKIKDLIPNLPREEKIFLVFDFWNEEFLGTYHRDDLMNLHIKSHSCRYLSIISMEEQSGKEPIFLSSNLHITQGCCEITDYEYFEEDKMLSIIIDLVGERSGSIFLRCPTNESISECNFPVDLLDKENNIWKINIKFQDSTEVEIKL